MTKAGTGGPQSGSGGGGGGGSDRKSSDKQPSAKAGRKSSSGGGNKSSKQKGGNASLHAVTSSGGGGGHHKGSSSSGAGGGGLSGGKSGVTATTSNNNNSGQSRSYPRGVGLDFRKLAGLTLVSYIDHHGVTVRPEAPPSELAVAVARHFEQMDVDEEDCVGGFLERLEAGPSVNTDYARKTQYYPSGYDNIPGTKRGGSTMIGKGGTKKLIKKGKDGKPIVTTTTTSPPNTIQTHPHRKRTKWAARPGEQVAAKVTRTDENGSWILASVQRFYPDTETYDVQDEDDTSKLIRLPWSHVMRLSTGAEGCFSKGSPECMAIFPETTSFYKAKVAKAPVWKLDHGVPTVKEIIVKFDDDEDGSGKTPHRRVPSRYVIPIPSTYFYDEQNDVDLTPPNSTGAVVSSGSGSGGSGSGNGGSGIISHGGHGSPAGPPSTSLVPSHTIGPMGPSSSSSLLGLSTSSSQAVAATAGK